MVYPSQEKKKLESINPKEYYFFTTRDLTLRRIEQIFDVFKDYMPDNSNIFDSLRIDDFLSKEENRDILIKHPKLLMSDMTAIELCFRKIIQETMTKNIAVDVEDLKVKIASVQRFFADTSIYRDIHKAIQRDKIVLVMGDPGTGKTVSSYMVLLTLMKNKYVPICSSSNNLDDIKKALGNDNKKEVVLMDDFLGRVDSTISATEYSKQLETLITFIKSKKNKLLLLNSRNYIWDFCNNNSSTFFRTIGQSNITIINTNKLDKNEKARILYNHIYHSNIPDDYKQEIIRGNFFLDIIKNSKYNPRVVEHFLMKKHYGTVEVSKYRNFIINTLNNPLLLWESEYKERLSQSDRILLQTLYSISEHNVSTDNLKTAYEKRISKIPTIDKTSEPYKSSLDSLTSSFLIRTSSYDLANPYISFSNPSIIDFIKNTISDVDRISMIESAVFLEQYDRLINNFIDSELIYNLINSREIFHLKVISNYDYPDILGLSYIVNHRHSFSSDISDFILSVLIDKRRNISYKQKYDYQSIIVEALRYDFASYFGLIESFMDESTFLSITSNLEYEYLLDVYYEFKSNYGYIISPVFVDLLKQKYLDSQNETILEHIDDRLSSLGGDIFYKTDDEIVNDMVDEGIDRVRDTLQTDPIIDDLFVVEDELIETYVANMSGEIYERIDTARKNDYDDRKEDYQLEDLEADNDDSDESIIDMFIG